VVGDNVWLGGGVIVCPGVGIAENSVVGAGAVDQVPARQGGRRWHPARVSRLL
jgi:maltose O-acetyltransferase